MAGTSPISAKLSYCRAASPRPACGERSEFARSSRKFRVRGPLRESERVESPRPSPRPSPRKSGAREQKARGHLMLAPMGTSPAMTSQRLCSCYWSGLRSTGIALFAPRPRGCLRNISNLILRSAAAGRRISKDGSRHGRASGHPSRRAQARSLHESENKTPNWPRVGE
jgi:hypothetical protein